MKRKRKTIICLGIVLAIVLVFFIKRPAGDMTFWLNGEIVSSDVFYDVIDRSTVKKYNPLDPTLRAVVVGENVLLIAARKTGKYHSEYFIELNGKPSGPFAGEPRYWFEGNDIVIVASIGNNSKFIFVNDKQFGPFTYVMDRRHIINGRHAFVVGTAEGMFVLYGEERFGPYKGVGELHSLDQNIAFKACTNCKGDFGLLEDWYVIHGAKKYGPYSSVFSQEYNDVLVTINGRIVFPAIKAGQAYIIDDLKETATGFKNYFDGFYLKDGKTLFLDVTCPPSEDVILQKVRCGTFQYDGMTFKKIPGQYDEP